jgi:hypothetical protein
LQERVSKPDQVEGVKDKLAKATGGRTKQAKASETATDVVQWLTKAINKLSCLDTAGWSKEENGFFNQAVRNFHEAVGSILNPAISSNLA